MGISHANSVGDDRVGSCMYMLRNHIVNKTCNLLQHKVLFNVTVDILKTHIKIGLPGEIERMIIHREEEVVQILQHQQV